MRRRTREVLSSAEREELALLRREYRHLEMERDILANRPRGTPRPRQMKLRLLDCGLA